MANRTREPDKTRTDLIDAAIRLLADQGVEALALRRVAGAAHVSTMCVYSRFGDKTGLLEAVYAAGFERLGLALSSVEPSRDPILLLRRIGLAYRRFAVANPALYALMFERVVCFDPSPELRSEALETTFSPVLDAVRAAIDQGVIEAESTLVAAYTLWTAAHGAISLELTHAAPKPLSGWLFDRRDTGEDIFRQAIDTAMRGMRPAGPAVA
jgi:AcrR family transcriptional regulator